MRSAQRAPARGTEIRFRAGSAYLPIVRTVAAVTAIHAELDADTVADIKIAVHESCALLVQQAAQEADVVCHCTAENHAVRFGAMVRCAAGRVPDPRSLSWQVISAMTDTAVTWVEPCGQESVLHIELRRRGPAA